MAQVNIHEAKTHLSRLVERAARGEEIVIARGGTPIARLIAYVSESEPRVFGSMRGLIEVPDGFDDRLPDEVLRAFYGVVES